MTSLFESDHLLKSVAREDFCPPRNFISVDLPDPAFPAINVILLSSATAHPKGGLKIFTLSDMRMLHLLTYEKKP